MKVRVGTSGYSYKEWVGTFYPPKTPANRMLASYGERLDTVEINNTFYRMPTPPMLETWAAQVPENFRFVLKAPRRITHIQRLQDVDDSLRVLIEAAKTLGPRRGPFLFQLPPFYRADLNVLRDFLGRMGPERAAFEFRHASWLEEPVYDLLRAHGAVLCLADTEEGEPPLVATATWGYLRLRRQDYDDAALQMWADRVRQQPWEEAYVFFKHEDEGKGPQLAARFRELAG